MSKISALQKQLEGSQSALSKALSELADTRERIERIRALVETLPGGLDYEANPDNPSPEDAVAFVGGLIWQICSETIVVDSTSQEAAIVRVTSPLTAWAAASVTEPP